MLCVTLAQHSHSVKTLFKKSPERADLELKDADYYNSVSTCLLNGQEELSDSIFLCGSHDNAPPLGHAADTLASPPNPTHQKTQEFLKIRDSNHSLGHRPTGNRFAELPAMDKDKKSRTVRNGCAADTIDVSSVDGVRTCMSTTQRINQTTPDGVVCTGHQSYCACEWNVDQHPCPVRTSG